MAAKSVKCKQFLQYGSQILDAQDAVYALMIGGPSTLYWYSSPAVAQASDPNWRKAEVLDCAALGYTLQQPINVGTYPAPFAVDGLGGMYGCDGELTYFVSTSSFDVNTGIQYADRSFSCKPTNQPGLEKFCNFFLPTDVLPPTISVADIPQKFGCRFLQ